MHMQHGQNDDKGESWEIRRISADLALESQAAQVYFRQP